MRHHMSRMLKNSKYLSIHLPAGQGLSAYVCECPGLSLNKEQLRKLLDDLNQVAHSILSKEKLDYGVFESSSSALSHSLITVLYEKKTGRPLAFNSMPILDVNIGNKNIHVLHLGLVMINPSVRSKGLSAMLYGFSCVLLFLRNQMRPIWISSVTQVPAVVGLVSELYSDVYPGLSGSRRTLYQKLIAKSIMEKHRRSFGVGADAEFDDESFIIRNAYTGGSETLRKTYDAAPKHRIELYNIMCQEKLDYNRGDDFIQIGLLNGRALQRYLMRMIPEGNFFGIITAFIFFIFRAILLPTLYWFDNRKEWAGLRIYEA